MGTRFLRVTITINYVSAGCGRGKTHGVSHYINETLYLKNSLYVAPTKILVNQTKQSLLQAGVPFEKIQVITTDTFELESYHEYILCV